MRAIVTLAGRLRGHLRDLVVVALSSFVVIVSGVTIATLSVSISARVITAMPVDGLLVALAVGVIVAATCVWIEQWVAHVLAYKVIDTLRLESHRAIARLAPLGLARRSAGDTVARAIGDAEALEWFYAHTAAQVIAGALASLVLSGVAVAAAGPVALIVPLAHVLLILVPLVTSSLALRQGQRLRDEIAGLSAVTLSARQGARDTLLLGRLDDLSSIVRERTARIQRARRAQSLRLGAEQSASELMSSLLTIGALIATVALVGASAIDATLAPAMIVFAVSSTSAALTISAAVAKLGEVRGAATRLQALMEAPGVRPDGDLEAADLHHRSGLAASSLRVSYPGDDRKILDGVSLHVAGGSMMAIVGASGAGKSTLIYALARLIPVEGSISIDGARIDDEPASSTRRRVSLAGQHSHVFRSSIRDNLLAPGLDDAAIWSALDAAHIGDRVRATPHGLDTVLDESGANWSGGERQRLGLARGLVRDAGVLLLDEPTAGLDADTESRFLETLQKVRGDRAVVVVTHREPVMKASDAIAVLEGGRIVDVGTHDELWVRCGEYRRLLNSADEAD